MRGSFRTVILAFLALAATAAVDGPTARAADGQLKLTVVDKDTGKLLPCRIHLKNAAGRPRRVPKLPFFHDHFVCPGEVTLRLPKGPYTFEIERGPEYLKVTGHFVINDFADDTKEVQLRRIVDMKKEGWWSGELHVHRDLKDIELLMQADDLHVAPVITWWNKNNAWKGNKLPEQPLVRFDGDRFYHQMAGEDERGGGALMFFNLKRPLQIADAQREYPSPMRYLQQAKERGAWVDVEKPFWWDVPTWVASGQVDSIGLANNHMQREKMYVSEAWGKPRDTDRFPPPRGNGEWSQYIYYQLLNCGLRIPPSAGSASGVLHSPVGYNRMYVHVDGPPEEFSYEKWWENLRAGRVVVTNGPLLRPKVDGELPGHVFRAEPGEELQLQATLNLTTQDPITYLEVIKNGRVNVAVHLKDWAKNRGQLPKLSFTESGWFLIRAVTDVQNTYRFASTGPYYVEIGDEPRISKQSAQFFLDWVNERIEGLKLEDEAQRREVLEFHEQARAFWQGKLEAANAK